MSDDAAARAERSRLRTIDPGLGSASRFVALPFHWTWALPLWRRLVRATPPHASADVQIDEHAGDTVALRVYRARFESTDASSRALTGAALLWLHGGGLMMGDPRMDDAHCASLVLATGLTVVSPRYRLAPKHRAPAALDDAHAAWTWLHDVAEEMEIDRSRIAVGGASAGAGVAACLAQRLRDEGGDAPAAQVLVYPMLDDATAARRELDAAGHLVWNNRANRAGWRAYLGFEPGPDTVPDYAVASRCNDLAGLPPTWIGVGQLDLFLDECRAYASRLARAGTSVEFVEIPGAPHGFDALRPEAGPSRVFESSYTRFLVGALRSADATTSNDGFHRVIRTD